METHRLDGGSPYFIESVSKRNLRWHSKQQEANWRGEEEKRSGEGPPLREFHFRELGDKGWEALPSSFLMSRANAEEEATSSQPFALLNIREGVSR